MTQDGLIYTIINTCNMYDCNNSATQKYVQSPFQTDAMKNTTQYQDQWKYSSVIIIMMYVTSNSCPDIEFPVHQYAIFTHNHKYSYEK